MLKLSKHFKHQFIKISVATLLFAIPLYPKFPLFPLPGSQVSIRLEDFLIAIIFGIWLILYFREALQLLKKPTIQAMALFFAIGLLSVLSAILITESVRAPVAILHWGRRIQYMSLFLIGLSSVKSKKDIAFYIKCLLITVFFIFIFGIGQKYFNFPVITTQNAEYAKGIALQYVNGGHLISTFAGHYDLATFLVLVLPLFIGLLFSSSKILKELNMGNVLVSRVLVFIIFIMGLWLLVNSASRISLVSYLGSATLVLFVLRKYLWIPVIIFFSVLFVGFSSNLIVRYMRIFEVTVQRLTLIPEVIAQDVPQRRTAASTPEPEAPPVFEDRSTSIRLNVEWPRAVRALEKNPLLGTGYSSITLATDNDYLRMLGEIGILGSMSFALVLASILYSFYPLIKIKATNLTEIFPIGILSAIPGVMLNMVFIDILEASKFATVFWLLLGISISTLKIAKYEQIN